MIAALTFRVHVDGSLVCPHRDLSVCPRCFRTTPGLVDVAGQVFAYHADEWPEGHAAIAAGRVSYLRLSPGTQP